MRAPDKLFSQQMSFAAHLRDPDGVAAPEGIEDRRLKIYRDLFYNNIEGFISGGFPVLRSLYPDERWHRLVQLFFQNYRCKTPYFIEIAQEFFEFLQSSYQSGSDDFPFLLELAHYEWVELAVDTTQEEPPTKGFNPKGNLIKGRPVISPLAFVLKYEYPVHQISPSYIPSEKPESPTFLIVYRTPQFQVKFMEINVATAGLLDLLEQNSDFIGLDAVNTLYKEWVGVNQASAIKSAETALNHLRKVGIILGSELRGVA